MGVAIVCSFSSGCYRVESRSGKQSIDFDESEMFGPTRVNMRNGTLTEMAAKSWFWDFYDDWKGAGKPTAGPDISTPNGPLHRAAWAQDVPTRATTGADLGPGTDKKDHPQ